MINRSSANISGCWSYLEEMYCFSAEESETECERRNGRQRILFLTSIVVSTMYTARCNIKVHSEAMGITHCVLSLHRTSV